MKDYITYNGKKYKRVNEVDAATQKKIDKLRADKKRQIDFQNRVKDFQQKATVGKKIDSLNRQIRKLRGESISESVDKRVTVKEVIKLKDLYPNQASFLMEARELDPKAVNYMKQLTARNNHTMARYQLALQMKNKRLMKLYSSIIDIQDAYGSLPMDVSNFRMSLEKELMSQAKRMYSNYDEISKAF